MDRLTRRDWLVAIVGGGPAGLSAALMLGRACKRVVLFDAGPPRNAAADEIHGFVTRDGTPPAEFRRVVTAPPVTSEPFAPADRCIVALHSPRLRSPP